MTQLPSLTAAEALQPNALERAGYLADDQRQAKRGQIFILFALFLTAMIGVLGLSIDVGYAVSQRRMMQNAADLAAIAGALAVSNYREDNQIAAATTVQEVIDGNQTHEGSPALEECRYVGADLEELDPSVACDSRVPEQAVGVTILVRETHSTFFIRAVPGAPTEVSTRGRATARVERLFWAGMDAPVIVCGYGTRLENGDELDVLLDDGHVNPEAIGETFRLTGQSYDDDRYGGGNDAAEIADCGLHDEAAQSAPEGLDNQVATCDDDDDCDDDKLRNETASYTPGEFRGWWLTIIDGNNENEGERRRIDDNTETRIELDNDFDDDIEDGDVYKIEPDLNNYGAVRNAKAWDGLAENQRNAQNNDGRDINTPWHGRTQSGQGPVRNTVTGLDGCRQGDREADGCVLLLPIATDGDHGGAPVLGDNEGDPPPMFMIVKVLAFMVEDCDDDGCEGTLLDDYPTWGGTLAPEEDPGPWCRDCGAVTVIKLRE